MIIVVVDVASGDSCRRSGGGGACCSGLRIHGCGGGGRSRGNCRRSSQTINPVLFLLHKNCM